MTKTDLRPETEKASEEKRRSAVSLEVDVNEARVLCFICGKSILESQASEIAGPSGQSIQVCQKHLEN